VKDESKISDLNNSQRYSNCDFLEDDVSFKEALDLLAYLMVCLDCKDDELKNEK